MEDWKCPKCGCQDSWFSRSLDVDSLGNEGMYYYCESCGTRLESYEEQKIRELNIAQKIHPIRGQRNFGIMIDDYLPSPQDQKP